MSKNKKLLLKILIRFIAYCQYSRNMFFGLSGIFKIKSHSSLAMIADILNNFLVPLTSVIFLRICFTSLIPVLKSIYYLIIYIFIYYSLSDKSNKFSCWSQKFCLTNLFHFVNLKHRVFWNFDISLYFLRMWPPEDIGLKTLFYTGFK